jgi:phenylpropionate dioxygenase-like ring-hydroxylating dioxygenase large terminal subunit
LLEYLGGQEQELGIMFDRRAGGTEVIGGAHKWVMNANWKYAADNFFGDDGHHTITHMSVRRVPVDKRYYARTNDDAKDDKNNRLALVAGASCAITTKHFEAGGLLAQLADRPGLVTSVLQRVAEFTRHMIRVWHPRGPEKTGRIALSTKDAPGGQGGDASPSDPNLGPAATEQDDMNN